VKDKNKRIVKKTRTRIRRICEEEEEEGSVNKEQEQEDL
jgi:hypothetical protein